MLDHQWKLKMMTSPFLLKLRVENPIVKQAVDQIQITMAMDMVMVQAVVRVEAEMSAAVKSPVMVGMKVVLKEEHSHMKELMVKVFMQDGTIPIKKKSESDAWTDYKEQVKSLNNQWSAELNDSYTADKQNFDKNTQIVENWSQSPLEEVVFIRSPMHDIDTQIKQSLPQELAGYQYLNYNRDDFKYYQDYQFKSSYKDELNTIRDSHSEFIPHSPQSYNAYKAGLMTLVDSDKNYVNGEINLGHINKEAAKRLLELAVDFGTDLLPLTGIAKDLYRGFVGKDPMTGQDLTSLERCLGVAFGTLGIVTLGASSFLTVGAKEIAALAKSTYKEARLSEEIAKAVNAATTNVHVMKYGTSGKFTIMGQGMDRVHEVSEALKKENISVETFEATSEAKLDWLEKRMKNPNGVPDRIARNTPIYIEDQIWVRDQIAKDNTILGLEEIDRYSTF